MEQVEQGWRQRYTECYDRPGGPPAEDAAPARAKIANPMALDANLAQTSAEQSASASKVVAGKRATVSSVVPGADASTMLIRSLVLLFIAILCVVLVVLIATSATWSSALGSTSKGKRSRVREPSLHLDASRDQVPPVLKPESKAAAARVKAPPTGKKLAPKKEAKATPSMDGNLWDADQEDSASEEEKKRNSRCGEPRQAYCAKSKLSFFYRYEHDFCDSSFHDQVFVCNHSPNRFSSLNGCTNACIKNSKPFSRCLHEAIFTKCNRNDLKYSYWYREGKACVEWKYPNGYCAAKHQGVARTLRECRDSCLGPGTHEGICTLPAEYTCPVHELKFPYFAHTFPNGTIQCLVADAEMLRPHQCMTGENKYASVDACRAACVRGHKNPASTNDTSLSEGL